MHAAIDNFEPERLMGALRIECIDQRRQSAGLQLSGGGIPV